MASTKTIEPKATVRNSLGMGFVTLLVVLAIWHLLVDTVACVIQPLWPSLETHLDLRAGRIFWLYLIWSMTTSFGQFVVGCLADRFPSRWLIWVAPTFALICMSCLGIATSVWGVAALLVGAGIGIAAFHPEAAAIAGSCLPENRSRAMSIFALSGYMGQSVGPLYSGYVTDRWTLSALGSLLICGLPVISMLYLCSYSVRWPELIARKPSKKSSLSIVDGKLLPVLLLIVIGTLRVFAALGIPLAMAFLLAWRGSTNTSIGIVQSAFMFGIGTGSIACALWIRHESERRALWTFPLYSLPFVWVIPGLSGWLLIASVTISGICIGITLPILISYGQRLLPDGQRMASSLTMGVTWGLGSALLAGIMATLKQWQRVDFAFVIFTLAVLISGILCFWLPNQQADTKMQSE